MLCLLPQGTRSELCAIPIFQFYSVASIHTTCCTAGITHGSRYARIGNDRCNLTYISRLLIGRVGEITDCFLLGTCTAEHNQSDFCWFLNIDFYIYILIYIFRIIIFHRCTSTGLIKTSRILYMSCPSISVGVEER